jgi:hypothetical protein
MLEEFGGQVNPGAIGDVEADDDGSRVGSRYCSKAELGLSIP